MPSFRLLDEQLNQGAVLAVLAIAVAFPGVLTQAANESSVQQVMKEFPDVVLSFGESDEYSFVLHKRTALYGRRSSKLVSLLVSCFTASYVRLWPQHLAGTEMRATPMFDGRAVCYPDLQTLRDYLSWRQVILLPTACRSVLLSFTCPKRVCVDSGAKALRQDACTSQAAQPACHWPPLTQADVHINNQYNTCFWSLVKAGSTPADAQATLKGTDSGFKNELLFNRFGINYSNLPEQFKKGSIVLRAAQRVVVKHRQDGTPVERERMVPTVLHVDLIGDAFWQERAALFA